MWCAVVKNILKVIKSVCFGKLKSSSVKEECWSAWAPAGTQLGDLCVQKCFFSSEQAEPGKLSRKPEKADVHFGRWRGCRGQGRPPTPRLTEASPLCVTAKRVREKRTGFTCINIYAYTYIYVYVSVHVCMYTYINHLFLLSLSAHMYMHIYLSMFLYASICRRIYVPVA